jgi:prolyl oligopeptidase
MKALPEKISTIFCCLLFYFILLNIKINSQERIIYPETRKMEHIDNYFGTEISDPYRWLEETDSPETIKWIESQNQVTFGYLSKIPYRDKIKARLTELWNYPRYSQPFKAGEYYFFSRNDGLQNQSILYIQKGLSGSPEVFLDPNKFSNDGTISLEGTDVSKDGKYLAYSISKSGSDWHEIFIMNIETRQLLPDHIQWVKFSGASWYNDGFFYGSYEHPKNGNDLTVKNEKQKIFYHKLGTDQKEDILIYSDEANPSRSHYIGTSEDEKYMFLYVNETGRKGNQIKFKPSMLSRDGFRAITDDSMQNTSFVLHSTDSSVFIYTEKDAPNGKVVKINLDDLSSPWQTIIPESNHPLDNISITGSRIFAQYMVDVVEKVSVFELDGKYLYDVSMPGVGNISGFSGKSTDEITFYTFTSLTAPPVTYSYNIKKNTSVLFHASEVKFNTVDFESKLIFYPSKDGTMIPMFIVYKKGLELNGSNPTYLYSYGGFGISMKPVFSASRIILLENGGVFAMPCIRGGSEYGTKWHEAGMLTNKQNVFDDFIAAAEYLISEKYTNPSRLAIAGGSNGGLLVGAVMNQRPDLFRVVFPAVGVMDMLRYQKFTIGSAWIKEYGSSDDENMFRYLLGYSPIHNIRPGVEYPATLVTTADHDDRVVPSHSFKYISTLQETYKGNNPVLIRIETKAGHGSGKPTSKYIEEISDQWAFMFYNMGITPIY